MQKRLLGILASVAVIAAACGGATTSSAPPAASDGAPPASADAPSTPPDSNLAADQVLRIDLGTEPPALDPNIAQDSTSIAVLNALHRGLTYLNEDLVASPALAESWDFSADGQTITFHLRDAVYSNGDPIVAGDFVYSWKRLVDPRTAAPYAYNMSDVVGGADLVALAGADPAPTDAEIDALLEEFGVSAPDDKTFVVNLVKPATYFLAIAGLWHSAPIQASWIESPERDRGRELRELRAIHHDDLGPQQPDRPRAEHDLLGPEADPHAHRDVDDRRAGGRPGGLRGW